MRLNYKYTISYTVIIFFTLLIGFSIIYSTLKRSTSQTAIGKLRNLNTVIAGQIASGNNYSADPSRKNAIIEWLPKFAKPTPEKVTVSRQWKAELQDSVTGISLSSVHNVKGKLLRITSKTFVMPADSVYLEGIFMVFAWTFVFLISVVVIASEVISGYILSPFYTTLQAVKNFSIDQQETIVLEKTSTHEFKELYSFLEKMTENAKKDYNILKEFSENASHELQTPIAVIKAKMELMMQSELTEAQHIMLTAMYEELEKLSKINHALTLLTKLEHFQPGDTPLLNLSKMLANTVNAISDLADLKGITITTHIDENVNVTISEELCRVLLNNLLSNAIRHNLTNGTIDVNLNQNRLVISNTGLEPVVSTEELFGRFKKNNQSLNSIGIGLAIVKKIVQIFNHKITYKYKASLHIIKITFAKVENQ
jgi:two-component system, OmpR family, sensor kinase